MLSMVPAQLELAEPSSLVWALVIAALLLALGWLGMRRHGKRHVLGALLLRTGAAALIVLAIAGFVETRDQTDRFEPAGTWRLTLPGGPTPTAAAAREFTDLPAFTNALRDALETPNPPAMTEVYAAAKDAASAKAAVTALGLPCRLFVAGAGDAAGVAPRILGWHAPAGVEPGESARIKVSTSGGDLRLLLDGKNLPHTGGELELTGLAPGAHVLEAELSGADGVVHRSGYVLRVGDKPHVLLIGMDARAVGRASAMLPDLQLRSLPVAAFNAAELLRDGRTVAAVLTHVDALLQMGESQAADLSGFVARGGGLFVTGDGAKFVPPENLSQRVRDLLPVLLLKESRQPKPDDPPVDEVATPTEIAKVSVCFVLDRSLSMEAAVPGGATRWQIAVKCVAESLKKLSVDARASILTFTLQQNWLERPRVFLPFDSRHAEERLNKTASDREFDDSGYNTDIYAAMESAINVIQDERTAVKLIILLTDGGDRRANTVEGKRLADLRQRAIGKDINIVAIGIGDEFTGGGPEVVAAQRVLDDLATKPEYKYIPTDPGKAPALFVESVETAFKTYDRKKEEEEEARRKRIEEQKATELEPATIDVMPGEFALELLPFGQALFGADPLPQPSPKVAWFARCLSRADGANALAVTRESETSPVLAFRAWGLGRVGFWGAGTDPESLGEVTGWAEFPALFAASMRWLLPAEQPDVRLVGEATTQGLRILDPLPEATYHLRVGQARVALKHDQGRLLPFEGELPVGAAEVIESVGEESRRIGDVYVSLQPASDATFTLVLPGSDAAPLAARPPVVTTVRVPVTHPALYLVVFVLMLLPIERLVRRRA